MLLGLRDQSWPFMRCRIQRCPNLARRCGALPSRDTARGAADDSRISPGACGRARRIGGEGVERDQATCLDDLS